MLILRCRIFKRRHVRIRPFGILARAWIILLHKWGSFLLGMSVFPPEEVGLWPPDGPVEIGRSLPRSRRINPQKIWGFYRIRAYPQWWWNRGSPTLARCSTSSCSAPSRRWASSNSFRATLRSSAYTAQSCFSNFIRLLKSSSCLRY